MGCCDDRSEIVVPPLILPPSPQLLVEYQYPTQPESSQQIYSQASVVETLPNPIKTFQYMMAFLPQSLCNMQ